MRTAIGTLAALTLGLAALAQQPPPAKYPPVLANAARPGPVLGGFGTAVWAMAAPGDGGTLMTAGENGFLASWTEDSAFGVRSGNAPAATWPAHKGPVLALASGGGTLASGGADGNLIVWDLVDGKPPRIIDVGAAVRAVAVTPDGTTIAVGGEGEAIPLLDVATGKFKSKLEGPAGWVLALAFTPDGKQIAAGGYGGRLWLCEVATGKKVYEVEALPPVPANTPAPPVNVVSALAFSPDGKLIAVGGSDGNVHVFQAADGKLLRSLAGHTGAITGVAFHPGNELLASTSKDRTVRLWNPANGQFLKALEGHTAWVQGVTFFARGTRLASAGADQTVRVWDITDLSKK
jgi:WD40 repeat protein